MSLDPVAARARLRCSVAQIDDILPDCLSAAERTMSPEGVEAWLDAASAICGLGRGTELVLIVLEDLPGVIAHTDESVPAAVADMAAWLSRSRCGKAINPFLSALPAVARRTGSAESLRAWIALIRGVIEAAEYPDDTAVALLSATPFVINQVSLEGYGNWVNFGLRTWKGQRHRYPEYFALRTPDAHAALQRERHGTLFVDHERQLALLMRAFWQSEERFRPYSLAFDHIRKPTPHIDKLGFHVPDVLDDKGGVKGIDRYRAMVAHMAAHRRWSRPYLADNFSPFQHVSVETFEDSRVEALAMRLYPGLRGLFQAQHPIPVQGACPEGWSCLRHRLAMVSRAILDPNHPYTDPLTVEYAARFHAEDLTDPESSVRLGRAFLTKIMDRTLGAPKVWFDDTVVDYRDDNRWLWHFLEPTDSAEDFHSDHGTPDVPEAEQTGDLLPPQHYPEWDFETRTERADWVTVYEANQPQGDAGDIDRLLARHRDLAKQIKRLVDRLKPQNRKRIRHQKDGEDLDLDLVIRAMIDTRAGVTPDERVYQSHVPDGRNIAVLLLLDLSQSLNEKTPSGSTLLQLSQEAVSLLGWAVEALGDPFAIAGFASETRHNVRYTHLKRFAEPWGEAPKARIASMEAAASTRMGAALRHAGRYLAAQKAEKKLLLLLSDGRPHDIDVDNPDYLKWDTHAAVGELHGQGITSFCITLDREADAYVSDIFGQAYAVVDQVETLPERLTRLFMALTKG
ncbi:MAG: VWA domain-containing protein [Rhodospirillaceae bacterium]